MACVVRGSARALPLLVPGRRLEIFVVREDVEVLALLAYVGCSFPPPTTGASSFDGPCLVVQPPSSDLVRVVHR